MRQAIAFAVLTLLGPTGPISADEPAMPSPSVGMPARIDGLVLPGAELEAVPLRDRESPVVLRIVEVYPHGDAFRYDLVFYGLEPGRHDLRDYLRRKDGTPAESLPPILVDVRAILPPGQVEPNGLPLAGSPRIGGYRFVIASAGFAWIAGLAAILLSGRRNPKRSAATASEPITLADRLRPLVEAAEAGTLAPAGRAELERLLIGYWRRRLGLEGAGHAEALAAMRADPQAGPLLVALEDWLHRPGRAYRVDVASLLAPYRDLPAEAAEAPQESLAPTQGGGGTR